MSRIILDGVKSPGHFVREGYAGVVDSGRIHMGTIASEGEFAVDSLYWKSDPERNGRVSLMMGCRIMGAVGKFPFGVGRITFDDPSFAMVQFDFTDKELASLILKGVQTKGYDMSDFRKLLCTGKGVMRLGINVDVLAVDGANVIYAVPKDAFCLSETSLSSGYDLSSHFSDQSKVLGNGITEPVFEGAQEFNINDISKTLTNETINKDIAVKAAEKSDPAKDFEGVDLGDGKNFDEKDFEEIELDEEEEREHIADLVKNSGYGDAEVTAQPEVEAAPEEEVVKAPENIAEVLDTKEVGDTVTAAQQLAETEKEIEAKRAELAAIQAKIEEERALAEEEARMRKAVAKGDIGDLPADKASDMAAATLAQMSAADLMAEPEDIAEKAAAEAVKNTSMGDLESDYEDVKKGDTKEIPAIDDSKVGPSAKATMEAAKKDAQETLEDLNAQIAAAAADSVPEIDTGVVEQGIKEGRSNIKEAVQGFDTSPVPTSEIEEALKGEGIAGLGDMDDFDDVFSASKQEFDSVPF